MPVNGIAGLNGGLVATGVGQGRVLMDGVLVDLKCLYFVPGAAQTLISVSELVEDGCRVIAQKVHGVHTISVENECGDVATMNVKNGLYEIPIEKCDNHAIWESDWSAIDQDGVLRGCAMIMGKSVGNSHTGDLSLGQLYHGRLGHFSSSNKRLARRISDAFGKQAGQGCTMAGCDACARAKMCPVFNRDPPTRPATRPLERVHLDLSPALPVKSTSGAVGYVVIVDEFTRYYVVETFKHKSEVFDILVAFKAEAEKHFRVKMGALSSPFELTGIRSDGEGQNKSGLIQDWCKANGIAREVSAPYTQHQDGIAERAIQTVWWGSEAMRKDAGAPPSLWERTLKAFVYVRNRMALGESERSPWEMWHLVTVDMKTRLHSVRKWGSKAYAYVDKSQRKKFGDRARVCVLLGYSDVSKAYILFDLTTRTVIEAASVIFDETSYPFRNGSMREAMLPVPPEVELAMEALFGDVDPVIGTGAGSDYELRVVAMEDHTDPEIGQLAPGGAGTVLYDDVSGDLPLDVRSPHGIDTLAELPLDSLVETNLVSVAKQRDRRPRMTLHEVGLAAAAGASEAAINAAGGSDSSSGVRRSVRTKFPINYLSAANAVRGNFLCPDVPQHVRCVVVGDVAEPGDHQLRVKYGNAVDLLCPRRDLPTGAVSVDPGPKPRSTGDARDLGISAMRARLAKVPVLPSGPAGADGSRMSGEISVPQMDESPIVRYRLDKKLDQPGLTRRDKIRIHSRIEKLELVSLSSQMSAKPPSSYEEAVAGVNGGDWLSSMREELGVMSDFGVWRLVNALPNAKVVGCRWVFALKRGPHGFVRRLKSRLVLKGYAQTPGVDYIDGETWAPTCRMRVFRFMMCEAATKVMRTAQWDATAAFLHADIDCNILMQQAPGFEVDGKVCELLKSIYGSKQASRLWYGMVRNRIMSIAKRLKGCTVEQSKADECFFTIRRGDEFIRLLIFVDDVAVTSTDDSLYNDVFADMCAAFKLTDYDGAEMSHYLGIAVQKVEGNIHLSQTAYIEELLERVCMTNCAGAASPEVPGSKGKLRKRAEGDHLAPNEAALMASVNYKSAVGALFYVARATRPDIVHAVGQVAMFMEHPAPEHWEAVQRIYRFLKRTKHTPLVMRASTASEPMCGFSDSDWAGDIDTSKSHTGWVVLCGGSPVAWFSKRQSCIAQSSCEAEYVSACSLSNELAWWRVLMEDVGFVLNAPLEIWCDNKSAGVLAQHSGNFERTKHIRLRYHVLRERQKDGEVVVRWCPASYQLADILTKNAGVAHFKDMASRLLGASVY